MAIFQTQWTIYEDVKFMARQTDSSQLIENCLTDAEFSELPGFYRNKVRDAYQLPGGRRLLISTDRQSAFDQILAAVPYKGEVLTRTARYADPRWGDQRVPICGLSCSDDFSSGTRSSANSARSSTRSARNAMRTSAYSGNGW